MTLIGKAGLIVIANRTPDAVSDAAYSLSSEDHWTSAKLLATRELGDVYPTTAVLRQNTLYVVHSKLNELIQLPPEQKSALHLEATIQPIGHVVP